jgi:hypothetical protein
MRFALGVGSTLLIKTGNATVEVWVFAKKDAAKSQVRVIQTWLYSWMHQEVDCEEEYEM